MSNRTSSVAFILMLVATASLAWSQESPSKDVQYAAAEVNELELRFELIRTPAAPYQAVQYRATLNNKGSRTLGPIWPLESRIALKNETSEEYRELRNYGFLYDSGRLESPTNLLKKYTRVPILLKQGEAISQSFAVAAEWNYEKVGDSFKPRGTPLFPNPGTYRLCYVYRQGLDKVTKTYATVKVPEPSGADKGVYDLVRKDQDLAAALMRT